VGEPAVFISSAHLREAWTSHLETATRTSFPLCRSKWRRILCATIAPVGMESCAWWFNAYAPGTLPVHAPSFNFLRRQQTAPGVQVRLQTRD
jgi:hypothetical protein